MADKITTVAAYWKIVRGGDRKLRPIPGPRLRTALLSRSARCRDEDPDEEERNQERKQEGKDEPSRHEPGKHQGTEHDQCRSGEHEDQQDRAAEKRHDSHEQPPAFGRELCRPDERVPIHYHCDMVTRVKQHPRENPEYR